MGILVGWQDHHVPFFKKPSDDLGIRLTGDEVKCLA